MFRKIWIFIGAVALATPISIAGMFPEQKFRTGDRPVAVAMADIDQDGRLDLITANTGRPDLTVLRGRPDGTFATVASYDVGLCVVVEDPSCECDPFWDPACEFCFYEACHIPVSVAVSDFDQDGRPDVVVASSSSAPHLWLSADLTVLLGNGDGTFSPGVSYTVVDSHRAVAAGDVDQDGRPDLVTASDLSNDVTVLLGHGDGSFAPGMRYDVGDRPWSLALGDFNQDGRADVVTANDASNDMTVLLGHGDGTFADGASYAAGTGPRSVAVGDLNQDGRPDVVTANSRSDDVAVLLGQGDGTFAAAVSYSAGSDAGAGPISVAIGDFDQDGRSDLVTANLLVSGTSFKGVTVLLGHGDGTFAAGMSYATGAGPRSLAVGDFDLDARLDIATVDVFSDDVTVLLGQGDGTFAAAVGYNTGLGLGSVAVSDFNLDGRRDIVKTNAPGTSDPFDDVTVLLGHDDGTFADGASYAVGHEPRSVAVGDFNQDGRPDVVTANFASDDVTVLLGQGDGTFATAVSYPAGNGPLSVAVGDFDQDDRQDLVTANKNSYDLTMLLGQGDGTFAAATSFAESWFRVPWFVAVGDFNQDGRPDLAKANPHPGDVTVLLGHGDGTFSTGINAPAGKAYSVAVGDFDGDGKHDLVTANSRRLRGGSGDLTVLLGLGDGTFADAVSYAANDRPSSVAVGDFNQDGTSDLITANLGHSMQGNGDVTVLLGLGDGTFDAGARHFAGKHPTSVAVGDFDQDGWQDVVAANSGISVLINQGGPLPISLDVKPGSSPNSINPNSRGVIPVAILGSDSFDVAEIDVSTLAFGPGGAPIAHLRGHLQDVNYDGIMDLMLHFRTADTGIACGDESATLIGETLDGQPIEGSDSIQTVGCRETRRPAIWMKDENRRNTSRSSGPIEIERE